jgi:hypothetical protein
MSQRHFRRTGLWITDKLSRELSVAFIVPLLTCCHDGHVPIGCGAAIVQSHAAGIAAWTARRPPETAPAPTSSPL